MINQKDLQANWSRVILRQRQSLSIWQPDYVKLRDAGIIGAGSAVLEAPSNYYRNSREEALHYDYHYVIEGEAIVETETMDYKLATGDFFCIPSWYARKLSCLNGIYNHIYFSITDSAAMHTFKTAEIIHRKALCLGEIKECLDALAEEEDKYDPVVGMIRRSRAELISHYLTREITASKQSSDSDYAARFEQVWSQVRFKPDADWSADRIARLLNISKPHLFHLCKLIYQCSPMLRVMQERMAVAAELLIKTNWSLGEIAEKCGYASEYSFSESFLKYYAVRPGKFRKKNPVIGNPSLFY